MKYLAEGIVTGESASEKLSKWNLSGNAVAMQTWCCWLAKAWGKVAVLKTLAQDGEHVLRRAAGMMPWIGAFPGGWLSPDIVHFSAGICKTF
ncbi:hypothetical protein ACQ4WY_21460 [Janthinobacterium sp. LB2P49]|uniref:hypothetical protein n=1 Tax=Janthinobacterium sp. LB2P49 TaxID=3424198 RepID=UPI003F211C08